MERQIATCGVYNSNKAGFANITEVRNYLHAEPEYNEFLVETVQDITAVAVQIASEQEDGYDSRELFSECRGWATEFEKMWNTYVEQGVEDDHDYMLEVEEFAEKKVNEYFDIENDEDE